MRCVVNILNGNKNQELQGEQVPTFLLRCTWESSWGKATTSEGNISKSYQLSGCCPQKGKSLKFSAVGERLNKGWYQCGMTNYAAIKSTQEKLYGSGKHSFYIAEGKSRTYHTFAFWLVRLQLTRLEIFPNFLTFLYWIYVTSLTRKNFKCHLK